MFKNLYRYYFKIWNELISNPHLNTNSLIGSYSQIHYIIWIFHFFEFYFVILIFFQCIEFWVIALSQVFWFLISI